jgi:uncharacterized lipoprotein YbaY
MFRSPLCLALCLAFVLTNAAFAQQIRDREVPGGATTRLNPYAPGATYRPELQAPRWRLGVEVDNTDAGVIVTGVYPGTAAQRQGIEVGDILVAVSGYQVGFVGGTLFDISDEFTLRADRFGRVDMLVQNRRNGRLVNMTIGLDPRDSGGMIPIWPPVTPPIVERTHTIAGAVTYREDVRLPATARLRVELVEYDRTGRERRVVTEYIARTLGKQKPLFYDLTFRKDQLDTTNTYAVRAYLDIDRAYTFYTPNPAPISPITPPPRLDIILAAPR